MRRIFAVIFACAMLLLLFGCPKNNGGGGGAGNDTGPAVNVTPASNGTVNQSITPSGPCADKKNVLEMDACLKDAAIGANDRSICGKIIEADTHDQCIYAFVGEGVAICDELTSLAKKDECLDFNARKAKSLSLCDRISDRTLRTACVNAVSPPCLAVLDRAEKETCLAIAYKNLSACQSEDCVFKYAVQLEDARACDGILGAAKKYACYSVANNSVRCKELALQPDRDYCFQLVAYEENTTSYCDFASPKTSYSNDCYTNVAIKMKTPSYCLGPALENDQNDCYLKYAIATGDTAVCESITYYSASMRKDSCYRQTAIKYNDPGICNGLAPGAERTSCYSMVLASDLPLKLEQCATIDNDAWKDTCYYRVAVQKGDKSICDSIVSANAKMNCVGKFVS